MKPPAWPQKEKAAPKDGPDFHFFFGGTNRFEVSRASALGFGAGFAPPGFAPPGLARKGLPSAPSARGLNGASPLGFQSPLGRSPSARGFLGAQSPLPPSAAWDLNPVARPAGRSAPSPWLLEPAARAGDADGNPSALFAVHTARRGLVELRRHRRKRRHRARSIDPHEIITRNRQLVLLASRRHPLEARILLTLIGMQ